MIFLISTRGVGVKILERRVTADKLQMYVNVSYTRVVLQATKSSEGVLWKIVSLCHPAYGMEQKKVHFDVSNTHMKSHVLSFFLLFKVLMYH